MTTEAFVYRWKHVLTGMVYIGKHKGTEDDGYISSGKLFLKAYKEAPHLFERTILYRGTDAECLAVEGECIKEAIIEYGYGNIYNLTHWSMLRENFIKCLTCDALCDPRNSEWLRIFTDEHFTGMCVKRERVKFEKKPLEVPQPRKAAKISKSTDTNGMTLREMKNELAYARKLSEQVGEDAYKHIKARISVLQDGIKGYKPENT